MHPPFRLANMAMFNAGLLKQRLEEVTAGNTCKIQFSIAPSNGDTDIIIYGNRHNAALEEIISEWLPNLTLSVRLGSPEVFLSRRAREDEILPVVVSMLSFVSLWFNGDVALPNLKESV